jgi:hypothetical protein
MPSIAHKLPEHDKLPTRDYAILKERAYKAWKEARARSVLPGAILDRLWSETLVAVRRAPVGVCSIMMYRSEVLFRLLQDRAGWLEHEDPPQPRRLRPAPRHGGPGKG